MKSSSFIFLLVIGFAVTARAQLDQSQLATDAFLGKPVSSRAFPTDNVNIVNYRGQTYDVTAGFKNDVAAYLIYKKRTGGNWTDEEIKEVLAAHLLGNEKWRWHKDIITGRHGPAVHQGPTNHITEPEVWHIFAHKQYTASYYPEKAALLIWDSEKGVAPADIFIHAPL